MRFTFRRFAGAKSTTTLRLSFGLDWRRMYPSFSNRFSTTDTPIAVTGLDISKTFVELARKNAANSGVHVQCEHGNASQMPFANQSFDFLVCRAAFKNFANPLGALKEMSRVLKPGARGLIIDLR